MGRSVETPELIIVLDDLDFAWKKGDIQRIKELYQAGASVEEMADCRRRAKWNFERVDKKIQLDNSADEVALVIMHLARTEEIEPRRHGL